MHKLFFARRTHNLFAIIFVLVVFLSLSACQPAPASVPQPLASPALASPQPDNAASQPASPTSPPATSAPLPLASPEATQSAATPEVTQSEASPESTQSVASPEATQSVASPEVTQSAASNSAALPVATQSAAFTCTDKAAFYGDVTIPDDTGFEQGVAFTKTWRFRNEGDCTWDETYAMVFAGGEILNGPLTAPLSARVAPGEIANLSVDLRTPDRGGVFRSYWEFQNAQGARFGTGAGGQEPFWAQVVVSWMPPGGGAPGGGNSSGGNPGQGAGNSGNAGNAGANPGNIPTTPPPASPPGENSSTPDPNPGSGASPSPTPQIPPAQGESTVPGAPAGCQAKANPGFLQVLLGLINQARAANGLERLAPSAPLYAAAAVHSADMACNNFVNHIGSDGSSWTTRIAAQGYAYSTALENIVVGNPDFGGNAQYAFDWWMNSQVHRDNILNPKATELGLGYVFNPASEYGGYFTLVLARP